MKRREFLIAGGGLLLSGRAASQAATTRLSRVGILEGSSRAARGHLIDAFKEGMRELRLIEGASVIFESRWADGKATDLSTLAADLVRLEADVIFAPTTLAALAAKRATRSIPIVFATPADPLGVGLVSSLARPGGNATGLTTINVEVVPKRLELLMEMSGRKVSRGALLFNSMDASNVLFVRAAQDAGRRVGVALRPHAVKAAEDFEPAFSAMAAERIEALMVAAGVLTDTHAKRIAELAARARVPAMYGSREFVAAGGLMSYSASFRDNYRRAAAYVAKILKGARPEDLAVEQASKFEFVINLTAAKALGITTPQSLLVRADEVIQ